MASCYNCGVNGSDFRRTVNTGSSFGTYYGKRTSYSTRNYYSKRTLCEECAFQHDKGIINSGIIGRWICAIILIFLIIHYKF